MKQKNISDLFTEKKDDAISIIIVNKDNYKKWFDKQSSSIRDWLNNTGYKATAGEIAFLPMKKTSVVASEGDGSDAFSLCGLYSVLPDGVYELKNIYDKRKINWLMLNLALDAYRYDRFKKNGKTKKIKFVVPEIADKNAVINTAEAFYIARDLINTPPNMMGPDEFTVVAKDIAMECKAEITVCSGKDLEKEYPAVFAVGKGSVRTPKVLILKWGKKNNPLISLIGKGVCFDTGGLNLKGEKSMRLMKKDMGGAAIALSLSRMIMKNKLPVSLFTVLPLVENSPGGGAYRPSDIITSRSGQTIEITNTDAEGRVILADALTKAGEQKPEIIIDFATLTGAARVALGPDIPPFFTNDDKIAETIDSLTVTTNEPMWRLPLYSGYNRYIDSKNADMANSSSIPMGGAITAALFLQKFVPEDTKWLHIDTYAYNDNKRNGRPEGGEAQTLRTIYELIKTLFAS